MFALGKERSDLDAVADGCRRWLDGLWAPEQGAAACRYAPSAARATVKSTALGCDVAAMLGLPERLSAERRAAIVADLQSLQRPEDGYFPDPEAEAQLRAVQGSVGEAESGDFSEFNTVLAEAALRGWGARPLHIVTRGADWQARQVREYLDGLPWASHPWGAGNKVSRYATTMLINAHLSGALTSPRLEAVFGWLAKNQDPETGLWGARVDGVLTNAVNGAFHIIRGSYGLLHVPVPRPERMIDSALDSVVVDPHFLPHKGDGCHDLDAIYVLYHASRSTAHRRDKIREWLRSRLPTLWEHQMADGGFSFHVGRSRGGWHSDGSAEGDMTGTIMYLGMLKMAAQLLDEPDVPWGYSCLHPAGGEPA